MTHQIFSAYPQPYLSRQSYQPTPDQLEFAKQSLIEKSRVSSGVQQLLFCRKVAESQFQQISLSEQTLIDSERKKYIDFIRRNYGQKIGEELLHFNKLKSRIKEVEDQRRAHKLGQEEAYNLNLAEQQLKKRQREQDRATGGKKKVKVDEAADKKAKELKGGAKDKETKGKKGKEQSKIKKKEEVEPAVVEDFAEDISNQESSNNLELANIPVSDEDMEFNDYEG